MGAPIPICTVSLPEYTAGEQPDYRAVGRKLDRVIEAHFPDRKLVIRGVSLIDHPGRSLEELVATILELGTDRYDPERNGVRYPDGASVDDIFACPFIVVSGKLESPHYQGDRCPSGSALGSVVSDFYEGTLVERGFHQRLDLLLVYDFDRLETSGVPDGRQPAEDGPGGLPDWCLFRFRDPARKPEALLGVVKIL